MPRFAVGNWTDGVERPETGVTFPSQWTAEHRACSGFTLVELAVVTLIIALFAGLTLPLLGQGRHRELRSTARRISGLTRWVYSEAALSGREHELVFDLQRQVFFARRLEADGQQVALSGPGRERSAAGRSRIVEVIVGGQRPFGEQTVAVRVLPLGWLEETVVHLESGEEARLTLRLMPLTGASEIHEGFLEF